MDELGRVLAAVPDAVVVVDHDGVIRRLNDEGVTLFGYDRDGLLGEPVELLVPTDRRESHVAARESYLADPEPRPMGADLDLHASRRDGSTFPVEISLGPIGIDGEPGVMATVVDITERIERERRLEAQNERLAEFASIVTHDIRNPLNVVEGRLDLYRETGDPDDLDAAEMALDRLEELIRDLLELAEHGRASVTLEAVAIGSVVRAAWAAVDTRDASYEVTGNPTICADPGQLQSLLENLVRNAVGHGGDSVAIEIGPLDGGFYVTDDGPGIPAEHREQIFEHGYTTAYEGTGIGLTIVRRIAEAHDWTVRITESETGGARFEFTGVELAEPSP